MLDLTGFNLQNPWRVGEFSGAKTYPRSVLNEALQWLPRDEVVVINGPRQVGKTTLLLQIIESLLNDGTNPADIFYFTLDEPGLIEFFKTPADFIEFIELNKSKRAYVFIDEVQRLENPGLFLKYIYDLKKDIKLIVTGSSSLEIRAKISEALTGRKRMIQMLPFGFDEYLEAKWKDYQRVGSRSKRKNREKTIAHLQKIHKLYGKSLEKFLSDYLVFGGYPRIIFEPHPQHKIQLLQEVFSSYIQKDVKDYFKIENIPGYNNLIRILAHQVGKLVNASEISLATGLHSATLDKYFYLLEGSFIFKRLTPFFRNVRKEISKMPKIYAMDLGMRNFSVGRFDDISLRADRGEIAENFVFSELNRRLVFPESLHFWRTQAKTEVDFVLDLNNRLIPLEVKFSSFKSPKITRSYRSFLATYSPEIGIIFTKDFIGESTVNDTRIVFMPLWSLGFIEITDLLNQRTKSL